MIEDGALTYRNSNEGILFWRFSDDLLNELAIAALLTILSYQTTETLINLCFGMKSYGYARLRDIQTMLMIRKSSPTAILRSLFVWMRTRNKYTSSRGIEEEEEEEEEEEKEKDGSRSRATYSGVYVKLAFLLLAIPFVNVVTVALSLEKDTTLSFKEADFGGLAYGMDREQSIKQWSPLAITPRNSCNGTLLRTNTAEFALAQFFSCVMLQENKPNSSNLTHVSLKRVKAEPVFLTIGMGSRTLVFVKRVMVLSQRANESLAEENKRVYFVSNILTRQQGEELLERGFELARTFCDSPEGPPVDENNIKKENDWAISRRITCQQNSQRTESEDVENAIQVARSVLDLLSFVNSDEFLVRDGDTESEEEQIEQPFVSGDSLVLLGRRRGFVSIPLLAISAFAAVLLRSMLELATRNDVERGIGLILRDGLGLPCCDSMLCSPDVVARYDSKGTVLYAVEREEDSLREE